MRAALLLVGVAACGAPAASTSSTSARSSSRPSAGELAATLAPDDVTNLASGENADAIWLAFDSGDAHVTALATRDSGWSIVGSARGPFASPVPDAAAPVGAVATPGSLTELLASPPLAATQLAPDGVVITTGKRVAGAEAKSTLGAQAVMLVVDTPTELVTTTYGLVHGNLELATPEGTLHLQGQLIALRAGDKWSVATAHHLAR